MNSKDKSVEMAAEILLDGGKLLRDSCPICRMPIFERKDHVLYCTTCNRELVRENKEPSQEVEPSSNPIQEKINSLSEQLRKEQDPQKIIEYANLIKTLQELL